LLQAQKQAMSDIQKGGEGMYATFHIDLESREYNNKYYTNIKCFKTS